MPEMFSKTPCVIHFPPNGRNPMCPWVRRARYPPKTPPCCSHWWGLCQSSQKPGLPACPTWKNRKLNLNFTEVFRLHTTLHPSRVHRGSRGIGKRSSLPSIKMLADNESCRSLVCVLLASGAPPTQRPRSEWGSRIYSSDGCVITRSNRGQGGHFLRGLKNKSLIMNQSTKFWC